MTRRDRIVPKQTPFLWAFVFLAVACAAEEKVTHRRTYGAGQDMGEEPRGNDARPGGVGGPNAVKEAAPEGELQLSAPAWTEQGDTLTVRWNAVPGAKSYQLTVATDKECAKPVLAKKDLAAIEWQTAQLAAGDYFVCVAANLADADAPKAAQNNGLALSVIAIKAPASRAAATVLSETGLYRDIKAKSVSPENLSFEPRYPLWSDGATKKRWAYLPRGAKIDTADMDRWVYPVGTVLWKEFAWEGRPVETRVFVKVAPEAGLGSWRYASYLWRDDGSEADLAAEGGVVEAKGTPLNVPAKRDCMTCHGGTKDVVLGFTALQLATAADAKTDAGKLNLSALVGQGKLTAPPAAMPAIAGSAADQAILGYLHGNCGHCHNPDSADYWTTHQLALRHEGAPTKREDEPAYASAVNRLGLLLGGNPDQSKIVTRTSSAVAGQRMPRLGSNVVDQAFVSALRQWIMALPPPPADKPTSGVLKTLADQYCVACHAPAAQVNFWRDLRAYAVKRIMEKSMPRPGSAAAAAMSDAERDQLVQAIKALP